MSEINYKDIGNLEVLRIAKELVLNEYNTRRAEEHNKWLVESDFLWKTQQLRLAYPALPPYPTEKDILERAHLLLNFIQSKKESDIKSSMTSQPEIKEEVKDVTVTLTPSESSSITESISDNVESKDINMTVNASNVTTISDSANNVSSSETIESNKEESLQKKELLEKSSSMYNSTLVSSSVIDADKKLRELSTEYFKLKKEVDEISSNTSASKLIPSIMKKIDDIRSSMTKEKSP